MVALTRTQRRLLSGQKPLVGAARVRLTGAPRARLSWDVPASRPTPTGWECGPRKRGWPSVLLTAGRACPAAE